MYNLQNKITALTVATAALDGNDGGFTDRERKFAKDVIMEMRQNALIEFTTELSKEIPPK